MSSGRAEMRQYCLCLWDWQANCSITKLLLSESTGHRTSWSLREVQLASMSTGTAVPELVGIATACHKGIAGLVCWSLDMCETASCIRCVFVQATSEVWWALVWYGRCVLFSLSYVRTYSAVAAFCWLLTPVDRIAKHCGSLGGMWPGRVSLFSLHPLSGSAGCGRCYGHACIRLGTLSSRVGSLTMVDRKSPPGCGWMLRAVRVVHRQWLRHLGAIWVRVWKWIVLLPFYRRLALACYWRATYGYRQCMCSIE